jgi:hypothetical protein
MAVMAAAALIALSQGAGAQVNSMVGTVRDSIGRPIADAELSVGASTARTDTLGRYYIAFPRSDSVTVHVRRMGFERVTFTVSAAYVAQNSVEVRMRAVAQSLTTVEVSTRELRSRTLMEGFDYRRSRGNGIFLTAQQIQARGSQQLSNILRGERGLEFVTGRMGRQSLRFAQYRGKNCEPLIWLDGRLTRNMEIDDFPATELEGIELYDGPSTTPGEFIRGPSAFCGAIVLWSKVPMLQRPPSK